MKYHARKTDHLIHLRPCLARLRRLAGHALAVSLIALMWFGALHQAAGQGTAFTYQGQLQEGGNPANGSYDLRFSLYTASAGGTLAAGFLTNSATVVSNGLFTVVLDFGTGTFDGTTYWLQIGVRTNGGGGFDALSPRQELTPAPYAIFAESASAGGLTGTIPAASLSGTYGGLLNFTNPGNSFTGDGSGLTGVNAATLDGLAPSSFWKTTGNAGTSPGANFLGTTDDEPLILRANNQNGFQLQYWLTGSALAISQYGINVIAGFSGNTISNNASGATIAGGGYVNRIAFTFPATFTSYPNVVTGDFGTIGGGYANTAGTDATVSGGFQNSAKGTASVVGGGQNNVAHGTGSFIGGGGTDGSTSDGNLASGALSVIGGGFGNTNTGYASTIGGGFKNTAGGSAFGSSTVGGGAANSASTDFATVGGGWENTASGTYSTVAGGFGNLAGGAGSFAAGRSAQTSHDGTFVWSDGSQTPFTGAGVNNAFNVLASGGTYFYNGGSGPQMTIEGAIRVYDNDIYLRTTADANHDGLAYRDTVAGITFDGPFLWGFSGGALGTVVPSEVSLTWDYHGNVWISNNCSVATLTIRGGADVAEPFEITARDEEVVPGAVVVIDKQNPGRLKLSDQAYDRHVAGVVSGANGINPGIQMQQQGLLEGGRNVALTGRVYVQADASNGAIEPGDLLTTSNIPGHAMRVTDNGKAQGAIIGKAMSGLGEGRGTVLVLVTLQ